MTLCENEKTLHSVTHDFDHLDIRNEKSGLCTQEHDSTDQPPPYEAHFATPISYPSPNPSHEAHHARLIPHLPQQTSTLSQQPSVGPSSATILPCVIPQISKPFGSAFGSPFTRAYPPSLASYNITQSDFLAFLDGLNEVFISHPILQGLSAAGGIMSMIHGTPIVQSVGMGLQITSDLSSAAASYTRTKVYMKACNADLFHPTGLQATIMTTKDMMARIGHPEQRLRLPPLDTVEDLDQYTASTPGEDPRVKAERRAMQPMNDPRVRRINALQGYVAPLDFNVPAVVAPDNLLNKMSAWQAQRVTAQHDKKEAKRRAKSQTSQRDDGRPVMREKDERKLERKLAKIEKELDKKDGRHKDREVRKAQKEYEREQRKIDKKLDRKLDRKLKKPGKGKGKAEDREEKQANKVRWLVITQWQGEDDIEEEETSDGGSLSPGRYH